MKRSFYCAALMLLSSSAYANSYSFVVGGHLIRIDASRGCYSRSCVSVSTSGVRQTRQRRDRYDEADTTPDKAPVKPAAPALPQASTPPSAPAASKPAVEPVASAPPPAPTIAAPKLASASTPTVIQPSAALPMTPVTARAATPPPAPPVTPPLANAVVPTPETPVKVVKVSRTTDDEPAETPLGDWQTEGIKGLVRIEQCGPALCGYVLNEASNSVGETVLNMKLKSAALWSGNIYSRDSGATYYATMTQKGANSLRVEACVLGRFFCSGNVWTRLAPKPEELVTSRQTSSGPKS